MPQGRGRAGRRRVDRGAVRRWARGGCGGIGTTISGSMLYMGWWWWWAWCAGICWMREGMHRTAWTSGCRGSPPPFPCPLPFPAPPVPVPRPACPPWPTSPPPSLLLGPVLAPGPWLCCALPCLPPCPCLVSLPLSPAPLPFPLLLAPLSFPCPCPCPLPYPVSLPPLPVPLPFPCLCPPPLLLLALRPTCAPAPLRRRERPDPCLVSVPLRCCSQLRPPLVPDLLLCLPPSLGRPPPLALRPRGLHPAPPECRPLPRGPRAAAVAAP